MVALIDRIGQCRTGYAEPGIQIEEGMMAVSWPAGVNTDAYGMESTPIENVERVQFESGKARTYLKNSAQKLAFSFLVSMDDVGPSSEYKQFVEWWDTTLKSGALSFGFPDLITHTGTTEYRPIAVYSATGQKRKEVTLTVEEM
jgi:hypothetical protein